MLSSYPSIYALGHRYIADLFKGPVTIEEKVDGSQFSFGVDENGNIFMRSKGSELHLGAVEKMFNKAAETVVRIARNLRPGWVYRGEYLQKPKHNVLAYDRVPNGNIILFDIMTGPEVYLSHAEKQVEAESLGLECVPCFFEGVWDREAATVTQFFDRISILGGQKIEGVVVKNYNQFTVDKKIMIGKFVCAEFKEIHRKEWKKENPTPVDIVEHIASELATPARWRKAVLHLREAGKITDTPQDIGPLLAEIKADVEKEEVDAIKNALYKHFGPQIMRQSTKGFPEWYKAELGIITQTPA